MRGGTYLWPLVLDSLPWNLVALFGLREAWRTRERGAVFCAIWWLALLAFFQIAAYKRRAYLLPALPAEALLAGWVLDRSWLRHEVVEGEVEPALSRASVATLFVLGAAALGAVLADDFPVLGPMARLDAAILLGGAAGAIAASALLVRALWQDRRAAALVYLWLLLSAYLIAAFPSVATATAAGDSSKPLVERVRAVLPADAALTICGVEEDATLPLLLYDPVPEMVTVVHGEAPCLPNLAPGFYLLPEPTWDAIETAAETRRHPWRELFRDDLRGHNKSRPVALVERLRSGSSREVAELAP
jgi:4-amino-4-deoxy-L-arabinose transferase-like glycosyltransferase